MRTSRDVYLEALDDLTGGGGKVFNIHDNGGADSVLVASYEGVPEELHTTAFSFGLSSADHEEWRLGKPELMTSVKSTDESWGLCMGEIVRNYRADSLFEYGTILHFRQRIADDCPMTSFFIFASSLLDKEQQCIVLPDRRVNIAQMYPIFEQEAGLVRDIGVERFFFDLKIDFFDLARPCVVRN